MNYELPKTLSMPIPERFEKLLFHFMYPPRPKMIEKILRYMRLHLDDITNSSINLERIINLVCKYYKISYEMLKERNRSRERVQARQMIFILARDCNCGSFNQIGSYFNMDHATVLYGVKAIKNHCETENKINEEYKKLKKHIKSE